MMYTQHDDIFNVRIYLLQYSIKGDDFFFTSAQSHTKNFFG